MIEREDPEAVRVEVYHLCPHGASGSALGPIDMVSYWWATPSGVRIVGDGALRDDVAQAVIAAVRVSPGDVVRAVQDQAGEAVD